MVRSIVSVLKQYSRFCIGYTDMCSESSSWNSLLLPAFTPEIDPWLEPPALPPDLMGGQRRALPSHKAHNKE